MRKVNRLILSLAAMLLLSCTSDDADLGTIRPINGSFSGTFASLNSDDLAGTVTLDITNSRYVCTTNLPYGVGAGKLVITKSTIQFIDTLFFPIPAIYGPTFVLSGEHPYTFDGNHLKIRTAKDAGNLVYILQKNN